MKRGYKYDERLKFYHYWSVGFYNKIDDNTNGPLNSDAILFSCGNTFLSSNLSILDTQRDFDESIHFVCEIEAFDCTDLRLGYLRDIHLHQFKLKCTRSIMNKDTLVNVYVGLPVAT